MPRQTLALIGIGVLAAFAGVAVARSRPAVNLGLTSARAGARTRIAVRTSLGSAVTGTLMSYELDLARGFGFDRQAALAVCSGRALRSDNCPELSRIGAGSGRIAVQGRYLPRTEYPVAASLYLAAPRHRGDLATVLLDLDQSQSSLEVALLGSVIGISHGAYGLALGFAHTARELPSAYHLTLAELELELGATAPVKGSAHSLFTNPRTCPPGGWPIAVTVASGHRSRTFTTSAHCV